MYIIVAETITKARCFMKRKIHEPYEKAKDAFAGKRVTYEDVAAVIGKTSTTVQLKMNGDSYFYLSEIDKICNKWNIPLKTFLP